MRHAEIQVDLDAIRANVARLRAATTAEVMTVVKADAYGHGALPVARAAVRAGASWLGVCTLDEALALRAGGITPPVLAGPTAPGLPPSGQLRRDAHPPGHPFRSGTHRDRDLRAVPDSRRALRAAAGDDGTCHSPCHQTGPGR